MTNLNSVMDAALHYRALGLSVIPIRTDGSKAPAVDQWKPYQTEIADEETIRNWFAKLGGIGIVAGRISGCLEVLDIDEPALIEPWKQLVRDAGAEALLEKLLMGTTPSGGLHVKYRCTSGIDGNQKLAVRKLEDGSIKTLFETRGEGGYVIAPGSPAECHPAKRVYTLIQGAYAAIPDLSKEERQILLSSARTLTEYVPPEIISVGATGGRFTAGDDFCVRGSWDFLWKAGWRKVRETGGLQYIKRPGKTGGGPSATIFSEANTIFNHSSNSPGLEPGQAYTRFAAYANVVHSGNYSRAAVDLAEQGYGLLPLNDTGNAQRFIDQCADKVLYAAEEHKWYVWNGQRWKLDHMGLAVKYAKEVAASIAREALLSQDPDQQSQIRNWCKISGNGPKIGQMIKLAENGLAVSANQLDQDGWLFNVENGTVDLHTGKLKPHDPADWITKLAPVHFDPDAKAPAFHKYLAEVLPDAAVREFFQRVIGYSMCASQEEQKIFFVTGEGANGKSTAMIVSAHVFGDYRQEAAPGLLLNKKFNQGAANNDVARMKGVRLVVTSEMARGSRLDEEMVKRATGGDRIAARYFFEEFFEFDPTHTLLVVTNHMPVIMDQDNAIWRRVKIIPFNVVFPEDQQDKHLKDKLIAEASGILNWAIEGCLRWQQEGLTDPEAVRACTSAYRAEMDSVQQFVDARCNMAGKEGSTVLYDAYKEFCKEQGENPVTQKEMAGRLKKLNCLPDRLADGKSAYKGICLAPLPDKRSEQEKMLDQMAGSK